MFLWVSVLGVAEMKIFLAIILEIGWFICFLFGQERRYVRRVSQMTIEEFILTIEVLNEESAIRTDAADQLDGAKRLETHG